MGDSFLKAHLHISVEAEVFIRRKRKMEERDQGRGVKSSLKQMSTVHSDKASGGPACISLV